jgi:hypothetical protein
MVYSLSITTSLYRHERSIPCQENLKNLLLLVHNVLSKSCAKLIEFIREIISLPEFIDRNRQTKTAFTRQRKLPFHILIAFLLNFVKGAYQDELDKFFRTINRLDVPKRLISKVALAKARMKLKFEAFVELNQHLVNYFEKHFNPITWNGFRLLAIDGSTTRLPQIRAVAEHFGVWRVRMGNPSPMARVSQLFDVLNKITVDALISPKGFGERTLAAQHLLKTRHGDLVLLDRGYPAWWLFSLILSRNAHFCARISCTKWKTLRKFFHSGRVEKIISLPIHATSVAFCKDMGLPIEPLQLRLIRIQNEGQVQVLITSLIDTQIYPVEIFHDLYHLRWPVEEDYKTIKCRMELENFSGKSVLSVYQDFHAKVFTKNLVCILAFHGNNALHQPHEHRKYQYQINFTQALSKSKGVIGLLLYEATSKVVQLVADLQHIFQRTIEPIRPGRKYPRKHKTSVRKFFPAYKPIG